LVTPSVAGMMGMREAPVLDMEGEGDMERLYTPTPCYPPR